MRMESRSPILSSGVPAGRNDAGRRQVADDLQCARTLRGDGHHLQPAAADFLDPLVAAPVRLADVGRLNHAALFQADERTFQVDAEQGGSVLGPGRCFDDPADVRLLFTGGEHARGGQERRRPEPGQRAAHVAHGVRAVGQHVAPARALHVQVDQSRQHEPAARVNHLGIRIQYLSDPSEAPALDEHRRPRHARRRDDLAAAHKVSAIAHPLVVSESDRLIRRSLYSIPRAEVKMFACGSRL